MDPMYCGWDAHSYTSLLKEHITPNKAPELFPNDLTTFDFTSKALEMLETIASKDPSFKRNIVKVLDRNRKLMNGYTDNQLNNIHIPHLYWKTFCIVKEDIDCYKAFEQTVADAGMTCTQGDSHRMAWLYWGLKNDRQTVVNKKEK